MRPSVEITIWDKYALRLVLLRITITAPAALALEHFINAATLVGL